MRYQLHYGSNFIRALVLQFCQSRLQQFIFVFITCNKLMACVFVYSNQLASGNPSDQAHPPPFKRQSSTTSRADSAVSSVPRLVEICH